MQRLNKRLKQLESKTIKGETVPVFLELIDDDNFEVYYEINDEKKTMSKEEFIDHGKKIKRNGIPINFEVDIGQWSDVHQEYLFK
ncbi:hypothetical protein ACQKKE_00920 [Desemzia incerta]|uniref:hypothetical protein n=1 Tax=Desemzia incerta TaxID=82801 RepID=UPI003CFDA2CB